MTEPASQVRAESFWVNVHEFRLFRLLRLLRHAFVLDYLCMHVALSKFVARILT